MIGNLPCLDIFGILQLMFKLSIAAVFQDVSRLLTWSTVRCVLGAARRMREFCSRPQVQLPQANVGSRRGTRPEEKAACETFAHLRRSSGMGPAIIHPVGWFFWDGFMDYLEISTDRSTIHESTLIWVWFGIWSFAWERAWVSHSIPHHKLVDLISQNLDWQQLWAPIRRGAHFTMSFLVVSDLFWASGTATTQTNSRSSHKEKRNQKPFETSKTTITIHYHHNKKKGNQMPILICFLVTAVSWSLVAKEDSPLVFCRMKKCCEPMNSDVESST